METSCFAIDSARRLHVFDDANEEVSFFNRDGYNKDGEDRTIVDIGRGGGSD